MSEHHHRRIGALFRRGYVVLALAVACLGIAPAPAADKLVAIKPVLTAAGAAAALGRALEVAQRNGWHVSIAVVDAAGNLMAFKRMDGVSVGTIDVVIGKARTAATAQMPSKNFQTNVDGGRPSLLAVKDLMPLEGGVPIIVKGIVIGAVASSGAKSVDDSQAAQAAADLIATQAAMP